MLLSDKNKILPTCMDLVDMPSEISQTKKNKYYMTSFICGI